jgi:5-enolpyruvylshikimate-3-phosphate synthase
VPLEQTVADAALPAFTVSTSSGQRLTIEGACSPAQVSALVLALCATAGA